MLIVSGSSARMASGLKDCPVDAAIVGIVDAVEVRTVASLDHVQLARVIGDVVVTPKDENLDGVTLLLVQPIAPDARAGRPPLVAVDAVGAGVGEDVFFVRGKEASFPVLSGRGAGRRRHRRHRRLTGTCRGEPQSS